MILLGVVSTPFWAPPTEKYPGRLPEKADVLVIGGGIAGVSLLWHLSARRIDAVLVERHHLAWGASGRNAGFLLAGVASSYAEAVHADGRSRAREIWEISNENHDRMKAPAREMAKGPVASRIADMPVYSNFGYRYWRQLPAGQVLVGGWRDTSLETEKTYEDEPTPEIQERLDRAARDLGAKAEVTHRWAGTMGFTESGLPMKGPLDGIPNVYICAGFTGHGMGFAFMTAKQVAESI